MKKKERSNAVHYSYISMQIGAHWSNARDGNSAIDEVPSPSPFNLVSWNLFIYLFLYGYKMRKAKKKKKKKNELRWERRKGRKKDQIEEKRKKKEKRKNK